MATTAPPAPGAPDGSCRTAPAPHRGDGEYNWFLAVLFPAEQLRILPYNRVVRDLGDLGPAGVLARLSRLGRLVTTDEPAPSRPASFGIYLKNAWYRLDLDEATIDRTDPIGSLDVSLLQDRVLGPILGIGDPRTDKRIDFVGGIRGRRRARASGALRRDGDRVLALPHDPGPAHGGVGRGPDHAAQEHVVRAQAAERALRAYFVGSR